jgi:AraC-like DNA-binding protein
MATLQPPPAPPAANIPAGSSGRVEFDDFDAVATVRTAFIDRYTQIGRGRASIRASIATTARMQLVSVARSPGVRIHGASAVAASLLAIPVESTALHLQGAPWASGTLGYVPPAREYEIMSAAPHRMLALAVEPARLDDLARARWDVAMPRTCSGPCFRAKDPSAVTRASRTWVRWLVAGMRRPGMLLHPVTAERRIDDICSAVHASSRALQNAFKHVYGIPPKSYQKALRLAAVRQGLKDGREGTTVSATAVRWGFFQFGYFAMDYRRMFGEGPSETLRSGRRVRPVVVPASLSPRSRPS